MRRIVLRNKMICHILDCCNQELEKDPGNIEILRTRGIAYNIGKKYIEAIEDLIQVIKALPEDASSYFLKSDCHFQLGEFEKAKQDFIRATLLEDNPKIEKSYIDDVTVPKDTELSDIEKVLEFERNKAILNIFPEIIDEDKNG